jgi:phage gpG-like protein
MIYQTIYLSQSQYNSFMGSLNTVLQSYVAKHKNELEQAFVAGGHQNRQGEAWTPLSPKYERAKRKSGYAGGILVRTGALSKSINGSLQGTTLKWSSNDPKAKFHQHGTRLMPARPIFVTTKQDVSNLVSDLVRAAQRGV